MQRGNSRLPWLAIQVVAALAVACSPGDASEDPGATTSSEAPGGLTDAELGRRILAADGEETLLALGVEHLGWTDRTRPALGLEELRELALSDLGLRWVGDFPDTAYAGDPGAPGER